MKTQKFYEEKAKKIHHYETKDPSIKRLQYKRTSMVKNAMKTFARPDSTILDIGCGDGQVTYAYHKFVKKVVGIDISKIRIKRASMLGMKNFVGKVGNATNLKFKDNSIENILCCSTLDHVPNPIKALKEMERAVKKGGCIFIELDNDFLPLSFKIRINKPMLDRLGHFNRIYYRKFKKMLKYTNLKEIKVYSWGSPFRFYYRLIKYFPFLKKGLDFIGKNTPQISYEYLVVLKK